MKTDINVDLSEIFSSIDDPKIKQSMSELNSLVENLCKMHKGKIVSYNAEQLFDLFQEYESYLIKNEDLRVFINMSFYTNMLDEKIQALKNQYQVLSTKNRMELSFIRLEIMELLLSNKKLVQESILKPYKNLLSVYLSFAPHRLSLIEEELILEKDQFGVIAWSELQKKWLASQEYEFELDGKLTKFHRGEYLKYLESTDRRIRKSAHQAVLTNSAKDGELYSFALRNICNNWISEYKRRNYSSPIEYSLKSNEINKTILDSMFNIIDDNVHLYQKTLRILAKLLNIPKIASYDFSASIPNTPVKNFPWEYGKELILESFSRFDDEFATVAKEMFDKKRIDATHRKGKASGAWCSRWYSGQTSFISQSYNGSKLDLLALAHELGHAIHLSLTIPNQTFMNTLGSLCIAETASFFGELILTDLLLEKAETKAEKIDILLDIVKRIGHIIWGLTSMYKFETQLYKAIEGGQFLDYKTISNLWIIERDKIFGNTVEYIEYDEAAWTSVPHYYLANTRYYNYPYIFAQLFVYALYQQYKKEKKSFNPKFKQLLEAGRSLSPEELGKIVGLDITSPEFWKLGIDQFSYFLEELDKLLD